MWISCSVEHFHSPAWLVLPWCLSLVQLEVRMQTAPRLRKALTEFPRSVLPQRDMNTIICWWFPHANKAKRRSHGISSSARAKRQRVSTSSRNWGRELSFGSWPRKPEMKPATGCRVPKITSEYQRKGSRLQTLQWTQSEGMRWQAQEPHHACVPLSLKVPVFAFF